MLEGQSGARLVPVGRERSRRTVEREHHDLAVVGGDVELSAVVGHVVNSASNRRPRKLTRTEAPTWGMTRNGISRE